MFKKILAPFLALSLLAIISSSIPTQVASRELRINQRNINEFNKTLQNLKDKDPQKAISQKLNKNKSDQNELISQQSENLQVQFSLKNKKINLKNKDKGDTSVGLPNSEKFDSVDLVDDKVVYSGQNAKADVIVESVDGGFRQIINIKDATAPDFYDFPVELLANEKLVVNDDGSVIITKPRSEKEQKLIPKDLPKDIKIPEYSIKLTIAKP